MNYSKSLEDVVREGVTVEKLKVFRNSLYQRRWYYKDVLKAHLEGKDVDMSNKEAVMKLMLTEDEIAIVNRMLRQEQQALATNTQST